MPIDLPTSPLAAPVHPDPYPYYAALVATRPLRYDDSVGMWVAANAESVEAVLMSADVLVRPPAERVPRALAGSAAGTLFGRLVRMTDGASHGPLKRAVAASIDRLADDHVATVATACAERLLAEPAPLASFPFRLPSYVVATLLGVPEDALVLATRWLDDVVSAFALGASIDVVDAGAEAADGLVALVRGAIVTPHDGDPEVMVANAVGLLVQSYEATAGLIGNTMRALAEHQPSAAVARVVREVLRHDAPVQNTRRFVARDAVVAGRPMRAGDAILVLLAAANRDPAANAAPDRFDTERASPRCYTFGAGAHRCPGQRLAVSIATAGVSALLAARPALLDRRGPARYRPALNTRVALL